MRALAAVALSAVTVGCLPACAGKTAPRVAPEAPPDTSKMLKVIGRWTIASACPVEAHRALTAAHVVDPRPFYKYPGFMPLVWQQGTRGGVLRVDRREDGEPLVQWERDLGIIVTETPMEFYPIADVRPGPGDTIWLSGYDWRDRKRAFADRVWTAKVLRLVAGILVFDPAGEPGTSGSCILNAKGEVVAINVGGKYVGASLTGKLGFGGEPDQVGIGWLVAR